MRTKIYRILSFIMILVLLIPHTAFAADTPSSWAEAEVGKAIELGLVKEELQSDYQANITRGDFCAMIMTLVNAQDEEIVKDLDLPENPFEDADADDILAAYALKIVTGKSESEFDPNGAILRQEAAAMLTRTASVFEMDTSAKTSYFADADNISPYAKQSVSFVYETGVMKGTGNALFSPNGFYTREQAYMTALRLYNVLNGIENERPTATALEVRIINSSAYGKPLGLLNGLIYYIGDDDCVYRAPVGSPDKAEMLLKLEEDDYAYTEFNVCNDVAIITIHYGGATMGHDTTTLILPDGSTETFAYRVKVYSNSGDYDISFGDGSGVSGPISYLEARTGGEDEFRAVGENGYSYGIYRKYNETMETISAVSGSGLVISGNELYVIAQYFDDEDFYSPGVYKVDLSTGKTERAIERTATSFEMSGGYIYFLGDDNLLYKTAIGQDLPEIVSEEKISAFFFLGNELFFTPFNEWDLLYKMSGGEAMPVTDINRGGGKIVDGYYTGISYMPGTDRSCGFVVDNAGNAYISDPQLDIKCITVICGMIWMVV